MDMAVEKDKGVKIETRFARDKLVPWQPQLKE